MGSRALILLLVVAAVGSLPASAQTSASYKLEEHAFNAGGRPDQGTVASSAGYRVTLDSLGESVGGRGPSSASFRMDAGFGPAYRPPGEVAGLRWASNTELEWDADPSAGVYNLYRDPIADLPGTHGECLAQDLSSTAYTETDTPLAGSGYFYLATVENRLGEEGTRGAQSDGTPRSGLNACP